MGLLESSSAPEQKVPNVNLDDEASTQHYKIDQEGNVRFNFKYFVKEYSELNSSLQSFKSLLKVESPAEMKFILIKMNELKGCMKSKEAKEQYEAFLSKLYSNQDKYYDTMKKYHQDIATIVQGCIDFLANSLRERKVFQFNEESDHEIHLTNRAKTVIANFGQFTEEMNYINRIEAELQVSPQELKSYDDLMKKFAETEEHIQSQFNFKGFAHYKSYLNTFEQIRSYLTAKLELMNKYVEVNQKMHQLYNTALRETKSANDYQEAISELLQYYSVVIKHRLIRHVEIRMKEITDIKNS